MQRSRAEESEAEAKQIERQNALSPDRQEPCNPARLNWGHGAFFRRKDQALDGEHAAMNRTEDDECPVRAVPKARKNHGRHQVKGSSPLAACAAAKRNIQIIAKPGAQADVPTTPELLQPR